jgi:hypothetical protein
VSKQPSIQAQNTLHLGEAETSSPNFNPTAIVPVTNSDLVTATLSLPIIISATPAPGTPKPGIFGAAFYSIDTPGGLEPMAATGLAWARTDLAWDALEPAKGQYNWDAVSSANQQIINAANKRLNIILIVGGTPGWALRQGYPCGAVDPSQLAAFGESMYQIVKHYSVAPYFVKYWEFWNEPDVDGSFGCWGDKTDTYYGGGNYGEMLKVIAPRIRAADPQAKILTGGLLLDCDPTKPPTGNKDGCLPSKFLEGILAAGAGDSFDGVSFHAYDFYAFDAVTQQSSYGNPNWSATMETTGPAAINKARFLRSVLQKYNQDNKILLNTETAVYCGTNMQQADCEYMNSDQYPDIKNIFIAQSYASALAEGFKANLWYSVLGYRSSALLDAQLAPTPAYQVYNFSSKMLTYATFIRAITEYSGVKGYEFLRGSKTTWIVWAPVNPTQSITLPSTPSAIYDMFGNTLVGSASIPVDKHPVYIEW